MVKLAFREGAGLAVLVLSRLGVGALVLWIAVAALGAPRRPPAGRWGAVWGMGALSAAVGVLLFGAAERIPASTTTLLLYAYPAMVAVASVALRRERLTGTKALALALGLGGVLLVLRTPLERLDPAGVALALASALCLAAYVIVAQRGTAAMSPFTAGALILSTAALVYAPIGAFTGELGTGGAGAAWWWPVGVGVATGAAIALFLAGLARLGPIRASIGSTVEPVASVILSALFLAEVLSGMQLVGGALVIAAVVTLPLARERDEGARAPQGPSIAGPPPVE